jgi:N-acetylglutamate synthase-like GNAT family acetyltransferase
MREAVEQDMTGIRHSLLANRLDNSRVEQTFWWIAVVHGLSAGTIGITIHEDCAELTGLTVDPLFRGKGLGHAMVEYACDQWTDPQKRKRLSEKMHIPFLTDKLWLITPMPGYFLPVNFILTDAELLPKGLKDQLTGLQAKWRGMRYQIYKL